MKKIILLILMAGFISSCAKALLPYEENTLCSRGKEGGVCGSLSDVYEYTIKQEKKK